MATQPIRFLGTGTPVSPVKNPRINREPTKRGIEFSGVTSARELKKNIQSKLNVPPTEIGRSAVTISRIVKSGFDAVA